VASFRSTLSEATEADLLLQIVDASDPDFRRQMLAVDGVLEEILTEPRPTLLVFNKADRLDDPTLAQGLRVEFPGCFVISARGGEGLAELRTEVWRQASGRSAATRDVVAQGGG
jgi:GTP-binding protein HflX